MIFNSHELTTPMFFFQIRFADLLQDSSLILCIKKERKKQMHNLPKLFSCYIFFCLYVCSKSGKFYFCFSLFIFAEKYMFGTPISNGIDVPRSDRCTFRLDSDVQKSGEILSATYPGKIGTLISRKKNDEK